MTEWHIITGEYPPQPGGVSDYTRYVARGLAQAGDRVHVWVRGYAEPTTSDHGIEVHQLKWGSLSCCRSSRILVQYVPHAFGWKAMNIPFCLWLWSKRPTPVWVMFHEVAMPVKRGQPLAHSIIGLVNRLMAQIVVHSADRIWVSIPAWEQMLRGFSRELPPVGWLPVPSGIPVIQDPAGVSALRARHKGPNSILLGHFSTYRTEISGMLAAELPLIMRRAPNTMMLLLGIGSQEFAAELVRRHPQLAARIHASGAQSPEDLSRYLSACDLMIQPYPDGVSSRRTSIVAALAHGRPVVTTAGRDTEDFWQSSPAVTLVPPSRISDAVNELAADVDKRKRMAVEALALYASRFDVRHTINALRGAANVLASVPVWGSQCESQS